MIHLTYLEILSNIEVRYWREVGSMLKVLLIVVFGLEEFIVRIDPVLILFEGKTKEVMS